MKIVFSPTSFDRERDARRVMRMLRKRELEAAHPEAVRPSGVALHLARFPIVCDECEKTYWANNPYASHPGCKGGAGRPSLAGFSG